MKRVLVPLAAGFEEMEGMIIIDLLRRAGVEVIVAGLEPGPIRASRGTTHVADVLLSQVMNEEFDMIVLPGGAGGAERLGTDVVLGEMLRRQYARDGYIGAICAAPNVLRKLKILGEGDRFTLHPATLQSSEGGTYVADERIVRAGKIITSIGPGSAFEFTLDLIAELCGPDQRDLVAAPLYLPPASVEK